MYTTVEQPHHQSKSYYPSSFKTITAPASVNPLQMTNDHLPHHHHHHHQNNINNNHHHHSHNNMYQQPSSPTTELSNSYQKLSLNLPPSDTKKFNFICLFFNRILNLKDPTVILEKDKNFHKNNSKLKHTTNNQPIEILKNLLFPHDIWLRDEIKIKDIKIKSTMLNEVNDMMEAELKDVNDQTTFEEITLNYYAKLLVAYKVYDIPTRLNIHQNLYYTAVTEEAEEDEANKNSDFDFGFLEKPVYRTSSNQSNHSQKSKDKRSSTGSNLSRKRFSSFLGSNGGAPSPENGYHQQQQSQQQQQQQQQQIHQYQQPQQQLSSTPPHPHLPPPPPPHQQQHQQQQQSTQQSNGSHSPGSTSPTIAQEGTFNNILSKSKLYGRIKKHRESQVSMNSTTSQQSTNSNRNSVSTNATTTSVGSGRRRSNYALNSIGASSLLSSASTIQDEHGHTSLCMEQRMENSKDKYEYYIQVLRLFKNSEQILRVLINSHNINNKLLKFIEFIKKKLLKFIMIDVMTMILTYCDLQCVNFYNVR